MDAGLSLGQVAGDAISRTAIYFVETGKSKPSMETLMLIAERTGRPLDYFLTNSSTMEPRSSPGTAEVERLIAVGDHAAAIAAGESLLGSKPGAELEARVRFLMATAHLRVAQPAQARRLAAAARVHFEAAGDRLMAAECLGSEASAAYVMQDPAAMALALDALAICRSLNPVPQITEARLLIILGGVYETSQDWSRAIDSYERAIAAGGVVQDLRRLSLTYGGLSRAYQEVGQFNQAAHFAQRALTLHETLADRASLARSENNLGLLLFKRGDVPQAREHLNRSVRLFEESKLETGKAAVLLSLCELSFACNELDEADRHAQEALSVAQKTSELATSGTAHAWLGRIAAARGDDALADAEFSIAFEVLDGADARQRLSQSRVFYAEILEARGDLVAANRELKLALIASRPALIAMPSDSRSATA